MKCRFLLVLLPLILTGCSSTGAFSWSSLSPFNWFSGNDMTISENGVGEMNAGTALNESAIRKALGDDYRIRSGMGYKAGQIVVYYQALKENSLSMVMYGKENSTVKRIEVYDPKIKTDWGVKIGTPFSELFSKAYGSCWQPEGEDAGKIECYASQTKHVTYLFSGEWLGPDGLIPSDDVLMNWKVEKISWYADVK